MKLNVGSLFEDFTLRTIIHLIGLESLNLLNQLEWIISSRLIFSIENRLSYNICASIAFGSCPNPSQGKPHMITTCQNDFKVIDVKVTEVKVTHVKVTDDCLESSHISVSIIVSEKKTQTNPIRITPIPSNN